MKAKVTVSRENRAFLGMLVQKEFLEQVQSVARSEGRSLNNWMQTYVLEYVEELVAKAGKSNRAKR